MTKVQRTNGNGGTLYVNDATTLGSLHDAIARSLLVVNTSTSLGNDVEVGWGDVGLGPAVYAEWIVDGMDSNPQWDTNSGDLIYPNTNRIFKVQNDAHAFQFRFYFDGDGTPFNYSGYNANLNQGYDLTNSEHYNSCDSMWTHMYGLSYYNVSNQWVSPYGQLIWYYCNTDGHWLLNIPDNSNSELYVDAPPDPGTCF
jgi:hypothetical protein